MVGECQLRELKIRIQVHRYIYVARITAYLNRHAGKYNRKNRTHNLILSNIKSIVQTIPYRSGLFHLCP